MSEQGEGGGEGTVRTCMSVEKLKLPVLAVSHGRFRLSFSLLGLAGQWGVDQTRGKVIMSLLMLSDDRRE